MAGRDRRNSRDRRDYKDDDGDNDHVYCFVPGEGIDVVVLAAFLKRWVDGTATIRASRHPKDLGRIGYTVGASCTLNRQALEVLLVDTHKWQREQSTRDFRRNPYDYWESDTFCDRKKKGPSPNITTIKLVEPGHWRLNSDNELHRVLHTVHASAREYLKDNGRYQDSESAGDLPNRVDLHRRSVVAEGAVSEHGDPRLPIFWHCAWKSVGDQRRFYSGFGANLGPDLGPLSVQHQWHSGNEAAEVFTWGVLGALESIDQDVDPGIEVMVNKPEVDCEKLLVNCVRGRSDVHVEVCLLAVRCVAFSFRRLNPEELFDAVQTAFSIDRDTKGQSMVDFGLSSSGDLLSLCAQVLTVRGDGDVDFFECPMRDFVLNADSRSPSLGHEIMARTCLRRMESRILQPWKGIMNIFSESSTHPFSRYARKYWNKHYAKGESSKNDLPARFVNTIELELTELADGDYVNFNIRHIALKISLEIARCNDWQALYALCCQMGAAAYNVVSSAQPHMVKHSLKPKTLSAPLEQILRVLDGSARENDGYPGHELRDTGVLLTIGHVEFSKTAWAESKLKNDLCFVICHEKDDPAEGTPSRLSGLEDVLRTLRLRDPDSTPKPVGIPYCGLTYTGKNSGNYGTSKTAIVRCHSSEDSNPGEYGFVQHEQQAQDMTGWEMIALDELGEK